MKILYVAGRYNPLKHDEGSGEDFNLYNAFIQDGHEVRIVGPLPDRANLLERLYRKLHGFFSKKRYAKYSMALLLSASREVARQISAFKPDVIFSHNLSALVKIKTRVPIVYLMDSILMGTEAQWPLFSRLEYLRMLCWERIVLKKSTRIITRSQWAIDYLTREYGIPPEKIILVQAAASLPQRVIPERFTDEKFDLSILHLLLVGRVYHLKGIDIAIEIVNQLNREGVNATLRVVGSAGENSAWVEFMGLFKKSDAAQLQAYADQYRWAHFLLHPARYDSAPIVTAEAAAFGLPTLTNAVGGIATTVQDGVSGVVLPTLSPASAYVTVIHHFIDHPEEYLALRRSTRERYERELNWEVVGKRIIEVLQQAAETDRTIPGKTGEGAK